MLYDNPESGVYFGEGDPPSALREDYLKPDTTAYGPGIYDVYGWQPQDADGLPSIRACVVTAQGVEDCSEPQPAAM